MKGRQSRRQQGSLAVTNALGLAARLGRSELMAGSCAPRGLALAQADATRLVAGLRAFSPADVGCAAWWDQRRTVERLNSGAHAIGAAAHVVTTALAASPTGMRVLVRELLLVEAWRDRVVPRLGASRALRTLAESSSAVRLALTMPVVQAWRAASPPCSCACTLHCTTRRCAPTCWSGACSVAAPQTTRTC